MNAYDAAGHTTSVSKTVDGTEYTTHFEYDTAGRVTHTTYPDGYMVDNTYYPGSGLLESVYSVSDFTTYATFSDYHQSGKIGQVNFGNSSPSPTATRYTYDPFSTRLTGLLTASGSYQPDQDLQSRMYSYTPAGDITSITDQIDGTVYSYTYDALHRLTGEQADPPKPARSSQAMVNGYSTSAPYHAAKKITFKGVQRSYAYDPNGNMTTGYDFTDPEHIAKRTFTYNAQNMPTRIEHERFGAVSIGYDAEGNRAWKSGPAGTTYYIGGHYQVTNGVATRYIFAGSLRVGMQTGLHPTNFSMAHSPQVYSFHKDHLGSTADVVDEMGSVTEEAAYLPYGGTRSLAANAGNTGNNYRYTDQEFDPETGLYNYNARLYDPWTGMFVTADTIVPNFADPQSLNRYMYCRNNPLVYVDPSGHSWRSFFKSVASAFVGAVAFVATGGVAAAAWTASFIGSCAAAGAASG